MRTMTVIQTVFKGLVSLCVIIFFFGKCTVKTDDNPETKTPEIKTAKPAAPLTIWDKIKKYEPQDIPTPDQIKSQVLALIKKAETRGYKFETYGYKSESLEMDFAEASFYCYGTSGQGIDIVTCFFNNKFNDNTYLRDEISANKHCPGFGLIRSHIEQQMLDGVEIEGSDGIEYWPGIDNKEATKEQLNDINKKYLAFLRYFTEELL